jgi:pimeloyl-ACP methyl ester carboxylesterase
MANPKTEGRAWILLRGLARDARHWGAFLETFRRTFPHDTIETLDIAGNGDQHARESFLSIHENVEDLRRRSKLLRSHAPVSLLAISMGGMMAMDWALRHPDEVERLVLINTSSRPFSRFFERLRPKNYVSLLALAGQTHRPEKIEASILRMTTHLLKDLTASAREQAKWPRTSAANFARQLWAAARFRVPRKPAVPLLFLLSRKDDLVNPICTRRLAQAWNLPWTEHESAGHDLPLDDPQWVADKIHDWCGR